MAKKVVEQTIVDKIIEKATASKKRILIPETGDIRIVEAVQMAIDNEVGRIVLFGKSDKYISYFNKKTLREIEFIDPDDHNVVEKYVDELVRLRAHKGMTKELAKKLLKDRLYLATMILKNGHVDGIVAGVVSKTEDVLRPAFQIIKTAPDISLASSCFIMEMKDKNFGENGAMLFADCAVNVDPNSAQLADIAIATAKSAEQLCNIKPKVALLSYSTKSIEEEITELVAKVKDAYLIVRRKDSSLCIDGELQADAAIVPQVAKIKSPRSDLRGKANVLIFPDINAGNICYKLVQRLGGITAVGPIIQGLAKPVNDVSRGASSYEIFATIAVTVLQAEAII